MKAHPNFKWYKVPTPPARTLVTRPSNNRGLLNEKSGQKSANCGITLGKLVDDELLGGLSSLINTSSSSSVTTGSSVSTTMAQKTPKGILKPPKKRYIINGEFKCYSEPLPIENRDIPTQNACSTLLEFAEICTSNAVRESASAILNFNDRDHESQTIIPSFTANNKYLQTDLESSDHTLPESLTYPVQYSMQKFEEEKGNLFSSEDYSSSRHTTIDSTDQEQPLNLCKNKGKTIKASNQQIIDHLVDKYLCDTSVPQNNYNKSSLIDSTFYKILSDDYTSNSPASKGEKKNHSSFTLSVAIESTLDKAHSKNGLNSKVEVPDYSAIVKHTANKSYDFNLQFKTDTAICSKSSLNSTNAFKPNVQNMEYSSSCYDVKSIKQSAVGISNNPVNNQKESEKIAYDRKNDSSGSPFFCKRNSPPKKSRVWCDIFMNEQLSKNESFEDNLHVSKGIVSDPPSPVRRNSQRTCKGRRYQELITEGLLQSSKERKANNNKKSVVPLDKGKRTVIHLENDLHCNSKKRRVEVSEKIKSSKAESHEFNQSLFNLDEKIALLPKCSFDHLGRKTAKFFEMNGEQDKNVYPSTSTSSDNFCSSSEASKWQAVSSGRYKTGDFDLEQYIASLPRCNIDMFKRKKD